MTEEINHPGPKPHLWDMRFFMLTLTFGLLWVYLVAQGATAFQLVSGGGYWLGLAPALAIEIGEVAALILWSSEAKSKAWSWQFGAVIVAAVLSAIAQYLAADSVAGDKIDIELKIALSVGVSTLAVFLGKSAGERFSAWQAEFQQWKTAEMEWRLAEEKQAERLEYERKQAEDSRKYRRKRKEERERLGAEYGKPERKELAQKPETRRESSDELSDVYVEHLNSLIEYLSENGISITASDACYIMGVGKSQTYKILSAGVSIGTLEKSGRKWRKVDGLEEEVSEVLSKDSEHD